MSANLDRSLDEVISSRRPRRGYGRRGSGIAKSTLLGSHPSRPSRMTAAPVATNVAIAPQVSDKIIVSNLPPDVNETQVRELFTQMIGPLRQVILTYDANGVSKGTASVVFVRQGDATKAYEQYHDRLIDGKRPMKIEIVVDPRKATAGVLPSLAARVGGVAVENGHAPTYNLRRGTGGPRRGRGRGRGGRRGNDRSPKTAEDLDAEMEDYTQSAPTS